MLIFKK